jgi:hypothetical protein
MKLAENETLYDTYRQLYRKSGYTLTYQDYCDQIYRQMEGPFGSSFSGGSRGQMQVTITWKERINLPPLSDDETTYNQNRNGEIFGDIPEVIVTPPYIIRSETVILQYASSGGDLSLSDVNTGLAFSAGAGAIELGNRLKPFRPILYNNGSFFRQGTIARNLRSGELMIGSRYLQTARGALYWTGTGATVFGMGLSTYHFINGDISGARYGTDMFFGLVGFMGLPGLMISTTYFIVTSPGFQQGMRDYQETKARDFGPGGDWEHLNSNFFYNGGLCFIEGTKITMGDGTLKPIENVGCGDTVLSYAFNKESIISTEVSRIDARVHNNLIQISFSNETINTNTEDHPYLVIGKGWSSFNPTQSSERYRIITAKLEIGDKCFVYQKGKLKKVKVTSIELKEGAVKTYNLTGLKFGNSYFANGILVNNENPIQNKAVEESKKGGKE